jgi:uncharacterized protein (TIGR00730 family)
MATFEQIQSSAYRLPALDHDFLMGESMRGIRFMLEYEKAEEALRAYGIKSTLVAFGSARIRQNGPGRQNFWYEQARLFGSIASQRGGALRHNGAVHENVIATGGGPGLMEAANRGAHEAGAPSIGFNITLPKEQTPNSYTTPELTFRFHYFVMRKMHLVMRAKALVVFPGGFGTLDELFEILNLLLTHKLPSLPVILFDRTYWSRLINFTMMVEEGMIAPEALSLFRFADTAQEAWTHLLDMGLTVPQT